MRTIMRAWTNTLISPTVPLQSTVKPWEEISIDRTDAPFGIKNDEAL